MTPKSKSYILPIFSLTLILLLIGTASAFIYYKIKGVSAVTGEAETKIVALEKEDRAFGDAVKSLENYGETIKLLDSAFLSEKGVVEFLKFMERLAKNAGVSLKTESAQLPNQKSSEATFRFKAEGDFGSLMKFFVLLDDLPYAGIITNMEIVPLAPQGNETKEQKIKNLQATISYAILNFAPVQ